MRSYRWFRQLLHFLNHTNPPYMRVTFFYIVFEGEVHYNILPWHRLTGCHWLQNMLYAVFQYNDGTVVRQKFRNAKCITLSSWIISFSGVGGAVLVEFVEQCCNLFRVDKIKHSVMQMRHWCSALLHFAFCTWLRCIAELQSGSMQKPESMRCHYPN